MQAQRDQLAATADLFKALGGGWDNATEQAAVARLSRTGEPDPDGFDYALIGANADQRAHALTKLESLNPGAVSGTQSAI